MSDVNFRFDLGRLSLNFVATVGARGSAHPVERLPTPSRLRDWIVESGLARGPADLPQVSGHDMQRAIALREALHRLVHDVFHGREPAAADLELVNEAARAADLPAPQLRRAPATGEWISEAVAPLTLEQVLAAIARDAVGLLGGDERSLLRECAGHTCDGIYVDRSRGFRRQWCSSKTCGNQVRVERFRERAAAA
jgi:predicted RNA-binding Zn ribbon-like protein